MAVAEIKIERRNPLRSNQGALRVSLHSLKVIEAGEPPEHVVSTTMPNPRIVSNTPLLIKQSFLRFAENHCCTWVRKVCIINTFGPF